jgi:hypothetical protein
MNHYKEQILISRGRIFNFRSFVTQNEICVVLCLFLLMRIIQKPILCTYFSRKRIMSTPGFGDMTSRDRFKPIQKFLHFADNTNNTNYEGPAKLLKIFPVLSYLNYTFQNLFFPGQNISVNKSLTLWRGRLSFK